MIENDVKEHGHAEAVPLRARPAGPTNIEGRHQLTLCQNMLGSNRKNRADAGGMHELHDKADGENKRAIGCCMDAKLGAPARAAPSHACRLPTPKVRASVAPRRNRESHD